MERRFARYTLEDCHQATGTVVVIDVLRAFTTAAVALARGAHEIILVGTVEEALATRDAGPDRLVAGEVDALPVRGFDHSNSPAELADLELADRTVILRTSSGTQGVVRAAGADHLLCASLANASATASELRARGRDCGFVISGARPDDRADEDRACADLIEALVLGIDIDRNAVLHRVRRARHARPFADPQDLRYPSADLEWACRLDWAPFAMVVERGERLVLRAR